ncbi:hypothetical protein QT972_32460 [Microcoleus sp. herbarium7]|uniref:hypothetical protein n=1 Tax=Microcoleus sp. herbarium7 TaxID=3055435 RepID=UPI002FD208E6
MPETKPIQPVIAAPTTAVAAPATPTATPATSPTTTPAAAPGATPAAKPAAPSSPLDFFTKLFGGDNKAEDASKKEAGAGKPEAGKAAAANNSQPSINYPPSPISKQHRDLKIQPEAAPISIRFLNGKLSGKVLDLKVSGNSFLGVAVSQISEDQAAEWSDQEGDHIRGGQNFKSIGARNFRFAVTFYDTQHDVSHLVEQLYQMHELSDRQESKNVFTPPLLYVQVGDKIIAPSVCTSISPQYDHPISNEKGYRYCQVDLNFKMLGGRGSPNMLAPPLTSTPLGDAVAKQTTAERSREAMIDKAKAVLGECLKEEGKASLDGILQETFGEGATQGSKGLSDPAAILKLDPNTRIQMAIGGMIPDSALKAKEIQDKLKQDIAILLASNEPGVTIESREIAEALQSGNPSRLPARFQEIFPQLKIDYDLITAAVQSGKLDGKDEVFKDTNRTATERLQKTGKCGLTMRQAGGVGTAQAVEKDQAEMLKKLNTTIKDGKDEDIKKAFGLTTESQVRNIKNGGPYQTREDFFNHLNQNGNGLTGYAAWGNFGEWIKKTEAAAKPAADAPPTIPAPTPAPTP